MSRRRKRTTKVIITRSFGHWPQTKMKKRPNWWKNFSYFEKNISPRKRKFFWQKMFLTCTCEIQSGIFFWKIYNVLLSRWHSSVCRNCISGSPSLSLSCNYKRVSGWKERLFNDIYCCCRFFGQQSVEQQNLLLLFSPWEKVFKIYRLLPTKGATFWREDKGSNDEKSFDRRSRRGVSSHKRVFACVCAAD